MLLDREGGQVNGDSSDCSFCRLDEPAVTVYRDATVQAFISLAPINRYHVIVTPRAHYDETRQASKR